MHVPSPLPAIVAAAVLLAACTSTGSSAAASASSAASAPGPSAAGSSSGRYGSGSAAPAGSASAMVAGTTVMTAQSPLGTILVDGSGRTLYVFLKDTGGDSTCYDTCAATWPALTVEGAISVGAGLDTSSFSTVDRKDGSKQVRVGDQPLYHFAKDSKPGDANGQGILGAWFVVGPNGQPIR